MSQPVQLRLSIDPLLAWFGPLWSEYPNPVDDFYARPLNYIVPAGMEVYAQLLGVSRRQMVRWKTGGVPLYSADEICVRMGVHPSEVWGNEWWQHEMIGAAAWSRS